MKTIIITKPDDWHVHLRDGDALPHTVIATAKHFQRALIMPNLTPALTTLQSLLDYRQRILAALPKNLHDFTPFMTFYLNQTIDPKDLELAENNPVILGAKLYPAGATTNSAAGVADIQAIYPVLDLMQQYNLVLQIHGETIHDDIFDREALFLTQYLQPIINNFPKLRIVLEHISTAAAVDFIQQAKDNVAATITPQHLLFNRNHLFANGINPHYYCLPILKRYQDQVALQTVATSNSGKFFAGTDSAPHSRTTKENSCGCAGIYSAPYAVALYTQIFDQLNSLDKLENFMSRFGAQFYQLPLNTQQLSLTKTTQHILTTLPLGTQQVIPILAGTAIDWSINENS